MELEKIRKVVQGWKLLNGIAQEDKAWDKLYFKRSTRSAKELLEYFDGDWEKAVDCMEDLAFEFKKDNLSFTIETIVKWAWKWRQKHEATPKT